MKCVPIAFLSVRVFGFLVAVVVIGVARLAHADAGDDSAAIQALFHEARELMDQHNYDQACPKLEHALRIDPAAVGVRFNLAECDEQIGRIASAWALFLDVASAEKLAGHVDREHAARAAAARLDASVPRLTIELRDAHVVIERDGEIVTADLLGTKLPINPGDHVIVASAAGKVSWRHELHIALGENASVAIPVLVAVPVAPVVAVLAPSATPPRQSLGAKRVASLIVGGLGVVALGVGVGFAAWSISDYAKSNDGYCDATTNTCPDPRGLSLRNDSFTHGDMATTAIAIGAGLAVAGVVLWLLPDHRTRARISGSSFAIESAW